MTPELAMGTDTLRPDDVASLARTPGARVFLPAHVRARMDRSVAARDDLIAGRCGVAHREDPIPKPRAHRILGGFTSRASTLTRSGMSVTV